jgi:hypothetical protein
MAAMRRARSIMIALPAFLALIAAPFFHIHLGAAGDSALFSEEHPTGVHHVHFPAPRRSAPGEGGGHADLDHSSPDTKSFVLLADRPAPDAPGPGTSIAVIPAPFHPLPLRVERSTAGMRAAIHAPPWRSLASLRAPPLTPSV